MIPILDLKAQYATLKSEILPAIEKVLDSCQYALGTEVAAFEKEFAAYCQAGAGVAVNSGTSALHLALEAAGVGPGDEVITVPFTFIATVAAVRYAGAVPVFVDVEPRTLTMDPAQIEKAITPRTKAILPVHLYGQCADMDPILAIAKARGLRVIEDAAQAHGAEYKGRRAGSMGDLGCFSFYCSKNLGAYGEAGMVVTSDPKLEATLRMLRDWGQEEKYKHKIKGYNARMDGIQGAILRVKFRHLEDWNESRRRHAALYRDALADASVRLPEELSHNRHVYHQFTIRHPRRDALREGLTRESIGWGIHYPIPAHLTEAHADLGYKAGDFPVAEEAAATVLSLPMFPEMTEEQARTVAAAVRRLSNGANA